MVKAALVPLTLPALSLLSIDPVVSVDQGAERVELFDLRVFIAAIALHF